MDVMFSMQPGEILLINLVSINYCVHYYFLVDWKLFVESIG